MPQDHTSSYVDAAAALIGLVVPPACRTGVEANLALFLRHAAIVAGYDDDPAREPAEALRP